MLKQKPPKPPFTDKELGVIWDALHGRRCQAANANNKEKVEFLYALLDKVGQLHDTQQKEQEKC